jgi:endonuclease III related protein
MEEYASSVSPSQSPTRLRVCASACRPRDLVYRIASHIPRGTVLTYGDVARLAGISNPRFVGSILHANPDPKHVPCQRIVDASGRVAKTFAFGGAVEQRRRLEREGVSFTRVRVDLTTSLWRPTSLFKHYVRLLKNYGDPGPWPWFGQDKPHTPEEIAIGAILTQNTNWKNVERAIANLRRERSCNLERIRRLASKDMATLQRLIRPSGFFRQKADRLARFATHVIGRYGTLTRFLRRPTSTVRKELLRLNGVGKETADTILLYAGDHPVFVIDAYTKRFAITNRLRVEPDYDALQTYFTERLPRDVRCFQDFHALIVQWGKDKS